MCYVPFGFHASGGITAEYGEVFLGQLLGGGDSDSDGDGDYSGESGGGGAVGAAASRQETTATRQQAADTPDSKSETQA
jgi:hypothetical protein